MAVDGCIEGIGSLLVASLGRLVSVTQSEETGGAFITRTQLRLGSSDH